MRVSEQYPGEIELYGVDYGPYLRRSRDSLTGTPGSFSVECSDTSATISAVAVDGSVVRFSLTSTAVGKCFVVDVTARTVAGRTRKKQIFVRIVPLSSSCESCN